MRKADLIKWLGNIKERYDDTCPHEAFDIAVIDEALTYIDKRGEGMDKIDDNLEAKVVPKNSVRLDASPVRASYSRDEILSEARKWMIEIYGEPLGMEYANEWMGKFGLLCSFLHDKFPVDH